MTDRRQRGGPKLYSRFRSGNITTGIRRLERVESAVRQASSGSNRLARLKRVLSLLSSVSSLIKKKGGPSIALLRGSTCKSHTTLPHRPLFGLGHGDIRAWGLETCAPSMHPCICAFRVVGTARKRRTMRALETREIPAVQPLAPLSCRMLAGRLSAPSGIAGPSLVLPAQLRKCS